MIRRITNHKKVAIASFGVLSVALCALALALANRTGPKLPDPLPPMTLTYEVY